MVKNVNYWYNEQCRTVILHLVRLFSNFYISEGKDEKGENLLKRVPCTFMSTDKSAAAMLIKNSDTIIQSCPKMILTIQNIKLNNELMSGSPYYEYESEFTEKQFNEESGNYEYKPGDTYHITRFNPVPIGFTIKLYIITTMLSQKFQLLEQIRALFSPTLEFQTSENPLDWTRISAITLTNLNWSSKGTMNLDSSTFDSMDFTFEINTNLDLPAIVSHSKIIENIITDIKESTDLENNWGWNLEDVVRTYYTPTETIINVDNGDEVTLIPNKQYDNWYKVFKTHGIKYNQNNTSVYLHCMTNNNIDDRKEIIGELIVDKKNPLKAKWLYDNSLLPQTNINDVNEIIDPTDFEPKNIDGERYLIVEDLSGNTSLWGQIYNKLGDKLEMVNSNSIIEYRNNRWEVDLDPLEEPAIYYLRDKSNYKFLYTYNDEYNVWVDVVCKKYRQGFWRLSTK